MSKTKGRLFKCLNYNIEEHGDVGVFNIGYLQGLGSINKVAAYHLLLR